MENLAVDILALLSPSGDQKQASPFSFITNDRQYSMENLTANCLELSSSTTTCLYEKVVGVFCSIIRPTYIAAAASVGFILASVDLGVATLGKILFLILNLNFFLHQEFDQLSHKSLPGSYSCSQFCEKQLSLCPAVRLNS